MASLGQWPSQLRRGSTRARRSCRGPRPACLRSCSDTHLPTQSPLSALPMGPGMSQPHILCCRSPSQPAVTPLGDHCWHLSFPVCLPRAPFKILSCTGCLSVRPNRHHPAVRGTVQGGAPGPQVPSSSGNVAVVTEKQDFKFYSSSTDLNFNSHTWEGLSVQMADSGGPEGPGLGGR